MNNFINKLEGVDRINEIAKMQIDGSNLLPKPISYKDIDVEMTNFVSDKFNVLFGEQEIKTFFFAQQRMSEFTKTWEMVDENKNIIPNFKIVTRENNPKPGTLQGGMFNIPGDRYYDIGTFNKWDGNKNITVTCKVKQPYCVDIIYNIKFITNRLNLLNELNNRVIDEFKSKQSYINVNGHYMCVTLEDVGDESDYDLDQRKIFLQNYQLKVSGYIINENDIIYVENVGRVIFNSEINKTKPFVNNKSNNGIEIDFPRKSKKVANFRSDGDYSISGILTDSNITSFIIRVNGDIVPNTFQLHKYDNLEVVIFRNTITEPSKITMLI